MSKDTQRGLEAALEAHVRDLYGDDAVIAEYAVLVQFNRLDLVDDGINGYMIEYPDHIAAHRPLGLVGYWNARLSHEAATSSDL